jgi:hypothetical protein
MKKLLLLFLTIVGFVGTASATDYYIGAEINSSWDIQGQMTDEDGDGTYSLIVNLPQQTGMYFTIFTSNSTTWANAYRPDNESSPWITNSVHEINMLESSGANNNSIYYPIGYDDANKNFARAIRIDYTPETHKLNVTRLIVVASGYNGWSTTTDYIAETSCGSKIYQGYVTLEANSADYDDGFKFVYFNYYNSNVNDDWGANNNGSLSNTASNYVVDADGVYELSANFNSWAWTDPNLVTVTASVGTYGMATLCSEYPLDFTDKSDAAVKAYLITGSNNTTYELTKTQVTGKIPANTGLYIEGAAGSSLDVPTTIFTTSVDENLLVGVTKDTPIEQTDGIYTNYILTVNKATGNVDVPKFYKVNSAGNKVLANKAYLQIETEYATREMLWFGGDEATSVNDVKLKANTVKGEVYDLQGRRVANPMKGLYIVNGKKVIF